MKINLKVTLDCPADCLCCSERIMNFKGKKSSKNQIDKLFEKIQLLFESAGDQDNHLSITGGEPTLVEGLAIYVKRLTDKGVSVGIDTNGWNVNEKWLEEMQISGLQYILLSVYSLNEENFNYLRGAKDGQLYARMRNALEILKSYKINNGSINVRVQTVLMKQNYYELPELLTLSIKSKFDALSTAYYISSKYNKELIMSQDDIDDFVNVYEPKMISVLQNYGIIGRLLKDNEMKIHNFFRFSNISIKEIEKGIYREKGYNCNERKRLVVYPNGDIVPCLGFDYIWDSKYALNLFKQECKNILANQMFDDFWRMNYSLCERCSSGYQIWLSLQNN